MSFCVWFFRIVVAALALGGATSAQSVGATAPPSAPITVTPQPAGRFLVVNASSSEQTVALNVVGNLVSNLRREGLLNGACDRLPKGFPKTSSPEKPGTAPRRAVTASVNDQNLRTLTLPPGMGNCVWVMVSAAAKTPSTSAQQQLIVSSSGDDRVQLNLPLGTGAPTPQAVPTTPLFPLETFTAPRVASCPTPVPFHTEQGQRLEACLNGENALVGVTGAKALAPGIYVNTTHFTKGAQPADAKVLMRQPWWHAALWIAAGLLLPALLRYLADRHRERKQLDYSLRQAGLNPARLPSFTPQVPGHGAPAPLRLDIPPGLLNPGLRVAPWQPFSDVENAYAALDVWRDLGTPRGLLARLNQAVISARAALGPPGTPSELLAFLDDIGQGRRLSLARDQNGQFVVPMDRAADVVASVNAARVLAQTAEAFLQAPLDPKNPNTAQLRQLIGRQTPASARAEDLQALTTTLAEVGDAARADVTTPVLPALPSSLEPAWHPEFLGASPSPARVNGAVRLAALPLILVTLLLAVVVGLEQLWATTEKAWGARGWLDYIYALAVGAGAYALSQVVQSQALKDALNLLSGSVLTRTTLGRR